MMSFLSRSKLLYSILKALKTYLLNFKFFISFAVQSFKQGRFIGGVFMLVLAPFISAHKLTEKPLAYRGEVPEFHYTLS